MSDALPAWQRVKRWRRAGTTRPMPTEVRNRACVGDANSAETVGCAITMTERIPAG
jgi:hypothetical protein